MWVIFIAVMLFTIFIGLLIWWIGNKIYLSIQRDNKKFESESEIYKKINEYVNKEE